MLWPGEGKREKSIRKLSKSWLYNLRVTLQSLQILLPLEVLVSLLFQFGCLSLCLPSSAGRLAAPATQPALHCTHLLWAQESHLSWTGNTSSSGLSNCTTKLSLIIQNPKLGACNISRAPGSNITVQCSTRDMSFRRFCCCCCCSDTESEADVNGPVSEEDYLLPGGAWDPSVSVARSRRSRRNTSRRRQGGEEEEEVNAYVPPDVPAATSLPNFNDFKLLKTVGKGAFGKVVS